VTLDLLLLAALAAAALAGAATGLLRQLSRLVAASLALLGARSLGPAIAGPVSRFVPPFAVGPVASALAFAALYLTLAVLLGLVARALRAAGGVPAAADRGGGALLGGAKAALVLWVLVSAVVAWGRPLPGVGPLHVEESGFAAFARERNALGLLSGREPRRMTPRERREAAAAGWHGVGEPVE
jgi:membrane protein required for colicin V production